MIDDSLICSGTIPDERLHDMRRDLRSPMGGGRGGSGGSGPRGAGVFLVDSVFMRSQDDTYHADKSLFLNPLDKASYGVRIGDIVLFYLNNEGILCTGVVMAISGDDVTFKKHDEISTVGFSPSIAITDIPGGHRVTVMNEVGSDSFDVMDGVQGPQGEPFEFDDFTPEQLEDLRSEIASVFYRKQETHVTISDVPTSVVHIPFSDYTSSSILFVDIEGLSLCENIDYVINGDDIELTSPITHANTIVNFKMLIVVALTQQDLDNIVASGIVDDVAEMVLARFGDELPVATQENNGLMSSSDKTKLDGIAENANNYSLPTMSVGTKGGAIVGDGLVMTGDALGIADAIRKGCVRSFETVVDMQASTTLEAGMTCHTNGFHSASDGGAAYYTISTTGTANGMDVLALQNSLLATLVVTEPYVTPEQFGAYGDGTRDDTAAIQAAVNACNIVEFSAKTYIVGSTINVPASREITGAGWDTVIMYSGTGVLFSLTDANGSVDVKLKNMHLRTNFTFSLMDTYGTAVEISSSLIINHNNWNNTLDNVRIFGFETGIHLTTDATSPSQHAYTSETLVTHCKIFQCTYPIVIDNLQSVNNVFMNTAIERNRQSTEPNTPLVSVYSGGVSLYGCSLIGSGAIIKTYHTTTGMNPLTMVNVCQCRAEVHKSPDGSELALFSHSSTLSGSQSVWFSVTDFVFNNQDTQYTRYLFSTNNRCVFNAKRITAVNNKCAVVDITNEISKTGIIGDSYVRVNVEGLSGWGWVPTDLSNGRYVGSTEMITTGAAGYGAEGGINWYVFNRLSFRQQQDGAFLSQKKYAYRQTNTATAGVSNFYCKLPNGAILFTFGVFKYSSASGQGPTLNLYMVKDIEDWAGSTFDKSTDAVLLDSLTLTGGRSGVVEKNVESTALVISRGYDSRVGRLEGFAEGRYLIELTSTVNCIPFVSFI